MADKVAVTLLSENERQRRITHSAALAMGEWLISAGVLRKPVGSLRIEEMEAMATAAISRWVVEWSAESVSDRPSSGPLLLL